MILTNFVWLLDKKVADRRRGMRRRTASTTGATAAHRPEPLHRPARSAPSQRHVPLHRLGTFRHLLMFALALTLVGRHSAPAAARPRVMAPIVASLATAALVLVIVVDPYSGTYASAALPAQRTLSQEAQRMTVVEGASATIAREAFTILAPPPVVVAPAAGKSDPASAKAIAQAKLTELGWGADQYDCLVSLWQKESGWNMYAANKSSGAYGIPQALPGKKMASAGADWQTNAATQISWGLSYISARYSTPCGAWSYFRSNGSY
jgi:hypothetical protein